MSDARSDVLVVFGATGDLAYKKIFPSLQSMVRRGHLNVPVIGVAKSGWNLEQFRQRARDSIQKHGEFDPQAFDRGWAARGIAAASPLLQHARTTHCFAASPSASSPPDRNTAGAPSPHTPGPANIQRRHEPD